LRHSPQVRREPNRLDLGTNWGQRFPCIALALSVGSRLRMRGWFFPPPWEEFEHGIPRKTQRPLPACLSPRR
jgi:hypothetical protein